MVRVRRWGFKGRNQLPLFMLWDEYRHGGIVEYASVVFSSQYLRQRWFWRALFMYATSRVKRAVGTRNICNRL